MGIASDFVQRALTQSTAGSTRTQNGGGASGTDGVYNFIKQAIDSNQDKLNSGPASGSTGADAGRNDAVGKAGTAVNANDTRGRGNRSYLREAVQDRQNAKNNPVTWDNFQSKLQQAQNQYFNYFDTFQNHYGVRQDLTEDDQRRLDRAGITLYNNKNFGNGLEDWKTYGEGQERQIKAQTAQLRSFLDQNADKLDKNASGEIRSLLDQMDSSSGELWRSAYDDRKAAQQQELYASRQQNINAANQNLGRINVRLADIDNQLTFGNLTAEQRIALNSEKRDLINQKSAATAAVKEAEKAADWDGRQELIDEYSKLQEEWVRLQQSGSVAAVEESGRIGLQMQDILEKLRAGDLAAGNGEQVYTGRDRAANVAVGTAANIGSNILNAALTTADATMQERAEGRERYEWDLADDFNRQQIEAANAEVPEFATLAPTAPQRTAAEKLAERSAQYNDQTRREKWDRLYAAADSISDAAQKDLQVAKEGLSSLGKAGVDIAENVLEMGFDAAVGGGSALVPMFIRTFGGSAQEARRAGASLDEQNQYGGAKAIIEVATEKLFDGVANIYGAGAADEITEALIGKLADTDMGRTFLRMVFSGAGEGIEEVISSLLAPLAESLYKDDSIGDLYRQINPADVLYDFIIGATIGTLGSGVSIANGQNAQANLQLRLNDSGVGDARSQASSAMDVLSGKTTAEEENMRQALNKARLADDIGGQNAAGGMNALENYVNQRRLSQYDNVAQTAPVAEQTNAQPEQMAPLTPEQAAEQEVRNALSGTVTNSVATRILTDPALREALGRLYPDLNLRGLTNSQARNAIKGLASQTAENAPQTQDVSADEITQPTAQTEATGEPQELNFNPTPEAETQEQGTPQATAQTGGVPGGVLGGLAPWNTTTAEATNGTGRQRERNMARNLGGNPNAESALSAYYRQNRQLYAQLTNNEVAAKAEGIIGKGFEAAREAVYNAIGRAQSGMKLAPEYAVAGYELANEMTRRGDIAGATELCSSIAAELTYAGQLGQIGRLILNTPAARIRTVEKLTERMNDAMTKSQRGKISKRNANVTPTEATEAAETAKDAAIQQLSDALNNQENQGGRGKNLRDTLDEQNRGGLFDFPGEAAKRVADSIKSQIKKSLRPAPQKNTLDTFVNYVKRFAKEKVGDVGQKSKPMTATEFLREVVNNEDLMRQVYERAQAEFSNENASGYREFVEDFVNTPIGLDSSDVRNRTFTKAIAESALAAEENNARYVREQEALGVPRNEISSRIADDLITKIGATGAIADSIRNAANDYVTQIVMGGELTSEEQVNRLVNNVMRTTGERFSELAPQDGMTKEGLRDAIARDIAAAYALSPESAERVADTVANEYDRLLGEAMQKELERRFKPKEKQARQMKDFGQQLTEAINLGAFDSEYAQNAITKLFGAPGEITISPELLQNYANAEGDEATNEALEAIKNDIASQIPATFRDKFIALRYLNMLGNLKTQARNIIGNTAMMIATDTKRTVQAVAELAAATISGGNYERNTSLTTDAAMRKQANDVFEKNVDDISGEAKYSDVRRQVGRDIQNRVTIFGSGESSEWASNLLSKALGREVDVKKNVLEDYRLLTNWAMEAGDVIFMRHTFNRAYAGWMKAHGISNISDATQEQQNRAYEFAKKEAQEATFHDSNTFSDAVSNFGRGPNAGPLMQIISEGIMPFRKTPANVAVRALEYSPVELIKVLWDASGHAKLGGKTINPLALDKEGNAKSTAEIINELSKSLTGSALAALGFALAKAGRARASGDDDDEQLNFFHKMQGASDYAVKVGDHWLSLSQFAPMSIPFFMGVKLNDLLESGLDDISLDDAWDILGIITDPMLEMSMLSGVNDLFNDVANLSGDTGAIPGLIIDSSLSYLSQGLTNSLLGQLEQANEENRQTTYVDRKSEDATAFDKFVGGLQYKLGQYSSKVPGIDYHQEDYIDAWGRTQSNGGAFARYANAFFNPTYITGDRSTEVDAELERLHTANRDVEGFPEVLPKKRGRSQLVGDGIVMTPDEYRRFSVESGQSKLNLVRDFMNSKQYKGMSDAERAQTIHDLYELADDRALQKVRDNYGITKKSDWDDEAQLSNPAQYLAAKAVLGADEPNYKHMDDVFRNWGSYSSDTQAALKGLSGVNNMRFAYDELGMGTERYNKDKAAIKKYETEGLEGEEKAAADALIITKHFKDYSDAEKLKTLEAQNPPTNKQTGKRAAIVRRYEAAMNVYGIPFDTWTKVEAYIQDAGSTKSSVLNQASKEAGLPVWQARWVYYKDSGNEKEIDVYNDFFPQDYVAKEKPSYLDYLEEAATEQAPTQNNGVESFLAGLLG